MRWYVLAACFSTELVTVFFTPCRFLSAVDCGDLKQPLNGQVFFQSTLFLSEATYSCNSGFELVGEGTRTCQANGQWSGEEPQCHRA